AVGSFTTIAGVSRSGAATITAAAPATVLPWNPSLSGSGYGVAVAGGRIAIGGDFQGWGFVARTGGIAVDLLTGDLLPWDPQIPIGSIVAMTTDGSRLFVGGSFSSVKGESRSRLAAFDLATQSLLPLSLTFDGAVRAFAVGSGRLYVGGDFAFVNATTRLH